MTPPSRLARANSRRPWLIGGSAAALLILIAAAVLALRRPEPPRLNADTVTIVRFVAGRDYMRLPVEKQSPYMQILEDREDKGELKSLFESGQLSEAEYRAALLEAWLGEQIKRSDKYASLSSGRAREGYIQSLLDKRQKKKSGSAISSGKSAGAARESGAGRIKRDGAAEDLRIAAWPAEMRSRWEAYDVAYSTAKDARDEARAAASSEHTPR